MGYATYGDLWGLESTVLIFYKSRLGFMGIYKSQPGFIQNQYN